MSHRAFDDGPLVDIVRRVVDVAQPETIILVGSAARGELGPTSDVDFPVSSDRKATRNLAARIHRGLRGVRVTVDALVITPIHVQRSKDSPALVIKPAVREGTVIIDAARASPIRCSTEVAEPAPPAIASRARGIPRESTWAIPRSKPSGQPKSQGVAVSPGHPANHWRLRTPTLGRGPPGHRCDKRHSGPTCTTSHWEPVLRPMRNPNRRLGRRRPHRLVGDDRRVGVATNREFGNLV